MPKPPDENDRLRAGTLPADPETDAAPMVDPALIERSRQDAEARAELERARVGHFVDAALARMEARAAGRERPIASPWAPLNDALAGGFWPGLHVLVGNTGSGKSQLALQLAVEAARNDVPVLYVGLELGRVDLVARLLGILTRRRWSRLYLGAGGPGELAELRARHGEAFAELGRMPFHLDVCPPMGWSYTELTRKAQGMRARYPERLDAYGHAIPGSRPLLIVLDFLQLVGSPPDTREDLRERIGHAAYAARAVARDLDAAVILVSSTARDNYAKVDGDKDGAKGPALGEGSPARFVGLGKESGEVEYAADSVLVLCRDLAQEPRKDGDEAWSTVWLALAKARARGEGPEAQRGWVELRFNGGRFEVGRAPRREVSL
jgi:replicative DNA helicase